MAFRELDRTHAGSFITPGSLDKMKSDINANFAELVGVQGLVVGTTAGTFAAGDDSRFTTTFTKRILRRVVLFGDSLCDINGGPRLDGSLQSFYTQGFFNWANAFLGGALELVCNSGISGDNTSNMLSRIQADVIAKTPDIVIVAGGINDLTSAVDAGTKATQIALVKTKLGAIYDTLGALGIVVVAVPIWPAGTARITSTFARQAISEVNIWIKRQVFTRQNLVVADMGAGHADPATNNEIVYPANSFPQYTTDELHLSGTGGCSSGYILANTLRPLVGNASMLQYDDSSNMLLNATWAGASGSTPPTSWTVTRISGTGTIAYTLVPRTDGIQGNWLQLVIGSAGSYVFSQSPGTLATGDQMMAFLEYQHTASTGTTDRAMCVQLDLRNAGAASQLKRQGLGQDDLNSGGTRIVDYRVPLRSGVVQTPIMTTPSSANGGFPAIDLKIFGEGTYLLGRVGLIKVN